ncbi:MAG: LPXTG cell wall anchor domain-containing protein [Blautia sp.]|nr:LPXTG cell wall anchor domain-containing protein [Blautia sp.]
MGYISLFALSKALEGAELPATGGPGTTIFYLTGALMMLFAAGLLGKKRAAQNS